jgi:hypothetical protein
LRSWSCGIAAAGWLAASSALADTPAALDEQEMPSRKNSTAFLSPTRATARWTALSFPPDTQVVVSAPWQSEPLTLGAIGPLYRWIESGKLSCRFDGAPGDAGFQTIECDEPGAQEKMTLSVKYWPETRSLHFGEGYLPGIGHADKQDMGFLLRGIYDASGKVEDLSQLEAR